MTGTGAGKTPGDPRALAAGRREAHERETRRSRVPSVLLSDGTEVETVVPRPPAPGGTLLGVAAAPGRVRGRARVVLDPSRAHLEPGEILVVPTTDPGWPPLFLTAGALVSETGSAVSHGPTVAREYGIPAVVGIRNTTRRITTGQWITVDGAAGTITLDTAAPPRGPGHANASGSPHAPTGRPCGHAAARVGKIGQAPARRR
ncbi:PEP-utilizing enzyme [Nocardiopsis synnemataformans]|uniref:PEP-utilizing enzyme n=1 Tax=Nocardiopsis synnemataformans TaxID=61305 RepID=UPI003EBA88FC